MNTKVTKVDRAGSGGVHIATEAVKGGKEEVLEGDVVLVCVGRRPFTEGLGLEVSSVEGHSTSPLATPINHAMP